MASQVLQIPPNCPQRPVSSSGEHFAVTASRRDPCTPTTPSAGAHPRASILHGAAHARAPAARPPRRAPPGPSAETRLQLCGRGEHGPPGASPTGSPLPFGDRVLDLQEFPVQLHFTCGHTSGGGRLAAAP